MITVNDIYAKYKKDVSYHSHWAISIYDMSGNVHFGYCNSVYPFEAIPEDIRETEVEYFTVGYEHLYLRINIPYAEYLTEEECEADGYSVLYPKENGTKILYRKTENGVSKYAVVDVLKAILMRNQSGK